MSASISTILLAALLLTSMGILGQSSVTALTNFNDTWKAMERRNTGINQTALRSDGVSYASPYVDVVVKNTGEEPLRDFTSWDLFLQYYTAGGTYYYLRAPYTTATAPADNKWTVRDIYVDAASTPEEFHPDILDPAEEMVIRVNVTPWADSSGANIILVGTRTGVTMRAAF